MKLHHLSINELHLGLKNNNFSALELKKYFSERIDKLQPKLNAVITKVDNLEAKINQKDINSITNNIPIIHKDTFCTQGIRTTAGSKILDNFIPPYNAHIVDELANAGMQIIAKANMDEFAMGSSNKNSAYGICKNPWNLNRISGGSSGGSAVCVAAGLTPIATGSDTGGSIRLPASHCGVTGIKPSYGNVSRYGLIAYASSLDQAGVFARRAEDCAHILQVMMNYDKRDSTQIPINKRDSLLTSKSLSQHLNSSVKNKKIGICQKLINNTDEAQTKVLDQAIKKLIDLGMIPIEVDLKYIDEALSAYYIIATAEASSNLSRYDGVRYGIRSKDAKNIEQVYAQSRAQGFGEEVKRRILLGTFVLSHGYYEAYYLSALKIRRLIINMFKEIFSKCDLLALPVSPKPPINIDSNNHPTDEYLSDVLTVPINLAGLPALSMPVGFTDNSLPIGLQLSAPYFGEGLLLSSAHQYQQITDFHLRYPPEFD